MFQATRFDPSPLLLRLERLADERFVIGRGRRLCHWVSFAVGGVLLAGTLDALLGLPAFLRVLLLVGWLLGLAWLAQRVRCVRREPLVSLALKVEAQQPHLGEALASAVQFSTEDRPLGSPRLRSLTIRRALDEAEEMEWRPLADWSRLGWPLVWLLLLGLAALAVALAGYRYTPTALARFFAPFADHPWPAQTRLTILAPDPLPARLGRGEPFVLRVAVAGRVPPRAQVTLWPEGGAPVVSPIIIQPTTAPTGDEPTGLIEYRPELSLLTRNFRFRVSAGDADTGYQQVAVLPAPKLVPLDGRPSPQIRLTYPAYTDLPPRDLPDGGSVVEAVLGTKVRIRAAVNQPVVTATLKRLTEPTDAAATQAATQAAAAAQSAEQFAVTIAPDGRSLEVELIPPRSGTYALSFTSAEGVTGSQGFDMRLQPDPSPSVRILQPRADSGPIYLQPNASVELLMRVDDPTFAIQSAGLEYRVNTDDAPRLLPCFESEQMATLARDLSRQLSPLTWAAILPSPEPPRLRWQALTIQRRLAVSMLTRADGSPLQVGDTVTLQGVATDFDDVTRDKPPGRSQEVITLVIVNPTGLEGLLQKGQLELREELARLQQLQAEARQKTESSAAQAKASGQLRPEDIEALLAAEQAQRDLKARIGNRDSGLQAQIDRLQQMAKDNQLPPSALLDRTDAVGAELARIVREELDQIEAKLNAARNQAQAERQQPQLADDLDRTVRQQQRVERSLGELLEQLDPGSGLEQIRADTRSLLQQQAKIADQLRQLAQRLQAGQRPDQLTADERADLERLALQQDRLGEQAAALLRKIDRAVPQKQEAARQRTELAQSKAAAAQQKRELAQQSDDPQQARQLLEVARKLAQEAQTLQAQAKATQREADLLRDAADTLRRDELNQRLTDTADQIRQNELGKAAAEQQRISQLLEQLAEKFQQRREEDLAQLARGLREAEGELARLIDEQDRLQREVEAVRQLDDAEQRRQLLEQLSRRQEQLREQTRELVQRLTRQRATPASEELSRATGRMDDAREQLNRGEFAEDTQDEVLDQLELAQRKLRQARQANEEELLRERMVRLADLVRALRERHVAGQTEAQRLRQSVEQAGRWDRPLLGSLAELSERHKHLAEELAGLSETKFAQLKVFQRLLGQSADAMEQLAGHYADHKELMLELLDTDPDAKLDPSQQAKFSRTADTLSQLALTRLDQVLEALKTDDLRAMREELELKQKQQAKAQPDQLPAAGGDDPDRPVAQRPPGELLPPSAQLKALRALQAEIIQRTQAFAKAHPDTSKLTPEEMAELRRLRQTQLEIAELIQEFMPPPPPPPSTPEDNRP